MAAGRAARRSLGVSGVVWSASPFHEDELWGHQRGLRTFAKASLSAAGWDPPQTLIGVSHWCVVLSVGRGVARSMLELVGSLLLSAEASAKREKSCQVPFSVF